MDLKLRAELFGKTEEEIRSEMAASLGRIGGRLQDILRSLENLRGNIETLAGSARIEKVQQYEELRKEAVLYRWYLIVQRESIGLVQHSSVADFYPIPVRIS